MLSKRGAVLAKLHPEMNAVNSCTLAEWKHFSGTWLHLIMIWWQMACLSWIIKRQAKASRHAHLNLMLPVFIMHRAYTHDMCMRLSAKKPQDNLGLESIQPGFLQDLM